MRGGSFVWGTLATFVAGAAAPAGAQSLQQELSRLLASHPRIAAAQANYAASGKGVDEAFAAYLPKVLLTGDAGYENTDSPSTRLVANGGTVETSRDKATLQIIQGLYDGSRREATYEVAQLNREISGDNLKAVSQEVLFNGVSAYLGALRAVRLVDLAGGNERTIMEQLQLEDERVRRGSGITVDVLFAKTRLQLAKERRVAFEGRLREAQANYQQVFGDAPDLAGLIEPPTPLDLLPADLDAAISRGLADNPTLAARDRQVAVAEQETTAARADYFPRLDLVARANREDDVEGIRGLRTDYSVLLQVTWELFSGFATDARVSQGALRRSERLQELNFAKRRVAEDVELAWNALVTARERVGLLDNAVAIASEVLEARKRLRAAGKESSINVLDAETESYNARINFVEASYDARLAAYRLLLAMGWLSPDRLRLER
jgi:adhesin transport system outer membrane protein